MHKANRSYDIFFNTTQTQMGAQVISELAKEIFVAILSSQVSQLKLRQKAIRS